MSSQEEQAWKLCGAGLCPRPGAIREVELLLSLGRLDEHQGAAQDQTGSAAPIPCYPGLGPSSMARTYFVSYQGDPHRVLETLAPYSRVLGSPRTSCSSGDVLGAQSNLVSTLSPQICSCWPL